ncbi:hypothetical protein PF005_g23389 [Phytophthora fragariae]|nr:hypothetical protein PF009_g14862 [Phytophthora fragariae]KAE9180176.1 hypothetical protein PF005_g23389 [Phytophthora fragariae]
MDRNKKVGPDAWRAHREGSTAGEVSHYGTCRSGGIGLILRFVPLRKSPAWKEAKLATAAPPPPPRPAAAAAAAAAAALPGSMKPRDQRQQRRTKLGPGKLRLEAEPAAAAPPQRPAAAAAAATADEAGAGQAPPGRTPS